MTKMKQTSSEDTSVFDILRARMGMPPIESILALPQESNSWSQQIADALIRHRKSVLRATSWWRVRRKLQMILTMLLLLVIGPVALQAQLPTKRVLTLNLAKKIAAAAEAEALRRGSTVVIAVVDDGGYLLVLERLDDTQVASVEVGIAKARTAAIFRRPSKVFEDQVKDGRVAALGLPGAAPLQGGVPIIFEGKVIGAIGVSGNTPQEDEDIAKVGAAALTVAIQGESK
jgi:uncharacterized protein GlcG (DUF336 family)